MMAEKRMFTQKIIDSDPFLDMPLSTQALYFHLNMRADDDGFINNPKRIQRTIGASEDDLKLLLAKRFVIGFENGVIVIKHWRMHNTLRKDRYNPTQYQEEFALLEVKDNNAYTEKMDGNLPATTWQPTGNQPEPQYSIGKNSIDKESTDKGSMPESCDSEPPAKPVRETTHTIFKRLLPDYILSEELQAKMAEWITYKVERKEGYKEQGMKSLLRQVENNVLKYGDHAVCDLIELCMASGWKGIIFDKLEKQSSRPAYQKQTKADELNNAYGMMAAWAERGE